VLATEDGGLRTSAAKESGSACCGLVHGPAQEEGCAGHLAGPKEKEVSGLMGLREKGGAAGWANGPNPRNEKRINAFLFLL
jgi:hypothetical protein